MLKLKSKKINAVVVDTETMGKDAKTIRVIDNSFTQLQVAQLMNTAQGVYGRLELGTIKWNQAYVDSFNKAIKFLAEARDA